MASDLEQYKATQKDVWSGGDYPQVAARIEPAARLLVREAGVRSGQRVLDVATGSGSVAVAAARTGATVVGVDLTDAWFDHARRHAAAAGVDVDLRIGDAEALPDDAPFDVVLSNFGAIFAPRHDVVAAELARMCRPGGTVAFTAWIPGSANDRLFSVLGEHLPEPPAFVMPFIRWGDPEHIRELFAGHGVEFRFLQRSLLWEFDSSAAVESFLLRDSGPFLATRQALERQGRWELAHEALHASVEEANEAADGSWRLTLDYLVAVGTTP